MWPLERQGETIALGTRDNRAAMTDPKLTAGR